jgi:hypothetical protein
METGEKGKQRKQYNIIYTYYVSNWIFNKKKLFVYVFDVYEVEVILYLPRCLPTNGDDQDRLKEC